MQLIDFNRIRRDLAVLEGDEFLERHDVGTLRAFRDEVADGDVVGDTAIEIFTSAVAAGLGLDDEAWYDLNGWPEWACPEHGVSELNLCQRTVIYWPVREGPNEDGAYRLPAGFNVNDEHDDGYFIECTATCDPRPGEAFRRGCGHRFELTGSHYEGDEWPFLWS